MRENIFLGRKENTIIRVHGVEQEEWSERGNKNNRAGK